MTQWLFLLLFLDDGTSGMWTSVELVDKNGLSVKGNDGKPPEIKYYESITDLKTQ